MDTTQLLITVCSVLGIVLVGAMAVIPSVMEALAARPEAPVAPAAPTTLGRRHRAGRSHHHPGHLAA